MINFRFHLVSLIAVFLALAVGVVVGSTVIDRAIVDGLEAQIERVERNADRQREANRELRDQLQRLTAFAEVASSYAIEGRLAGVPVVVFAVRGIDEEVARSALRALRDAGGVVPAILWLEPSWALVDDEERAALGEVLGEPEASPTRLRGRALGALVRRIRAGGFVPAEALPAPGPPSGEGGTQSAAPRDPLVALREAGFVSVDRAGGEEVDLNLYPGAGARVVVIDGAGAGVPSSVLVVPLVRALAGAPLLTLTAEASPDDAAAETVTGVRAVRGDRQLAGRVSTVDDIGGVEGRTALVLALAELGGGSSGHYGRREGATREIPERAAR